jgi:hypothetical protein
MFATNSCNEILQPSPCILQPSPCILQPSPCMRFCKGSSIKGYRHAFLFKNSLRVFKMEIRSCSATGSLKDYAGKKKKTSLSQVKGSCYV